MEQADTVSEKNGHFDPRQAADEMAENQIMLAMEREEPLKPANVPPVVMTCASMIQPEVVNWLWYPYLPKGKLCLLGGDPGLGKTWVALALAAAYSRGRWPFVTDGPSSELEPGQTLFCASEDGMADTLIPRLRGMGADLDRVVFLEGKKDKKGDLQRIVMNEEEILTYAITECKAKLIIFDPFQRFLPPKTKMNEMETVSPVVRALIRVAEKTQATVLLLGHLNKSKQDTLAYKFMGSVDWFAAARSAMMVMKDPENTRSGRFLYQVKNSLAPEAGGVSFSLQETDRPFMWGQQTSVSAEEMFSTVNSKKTRADEATTFLLAELRDGEQESDLILAKGKDCGLSRNALFEAKKELGVLARKIGFQGKWYWILPEEHNQ
jgi:RecA-family ATPase